MAVKLLELLIGKLRSMHIAVLGNIGHFYLRNFSLTSARSSNRASEYLLAQFHQDVHFLREICEFIDIRTTYLAEIVHRDSSDLGYCDASGVGAGGV